jgi:hypothetical protein
VACVYTLIIGITIGLVLEHLDKIFDYINNKANKKEKDENE